jgi:hypothetical protein
MLLKDNECVTLMVEAVSISVTLVHFNESTQHYIPEGCHLHTCCRENLRSSACIRCMHIVQVTHEKKYLNYRLIFQGNLGWGELIVRERDVTE